MTICTDRKKYTAKEIATDIEAYIIDTSPGNSTALATSKKLAQRYNVSSMTVNRAITTLVEKGLIYRVQGKGTFVARQKIKSRNKLVGYFAWQYRSSSWDEAAYGTFENILTNELDKLGVKVDFIHRPGYRSRIISFSEAIKYDLLIIPSGMITSQTLPWLERLSAPIIITGDAQVLPYPFHQVCHYYDLGFERALTYLKKKGVKNIFIACIENEASQIRAKVLRKVADKMGIHHETLPFGNQQLTLETPLILLAGRSQGKYFLDNNLDGVIFALSDFIALGIIDVVRERDLELGKDIGIISYDNLESRAPFNSDNAVITSITHPLVELARETVKLADDILENNVKDLHVTKIVKVPAREFVIRKSFY